jgi:hypothetical protein
VHDYAIDNCFIVEHQQADLAHRRRWDGESLVRVGGWSRLQLKRHRGHLAFRFALKTLMVRTISGRICSKVLTLAKNMRVVDCPKSLYRHFGKL